MKRINRGFFTVLFITLVTLFFYLPIASAETGAEIDRDANSAIKKLYSSSPAAKKLSQSAKGILVFPNVIKAGLIIGGQYGTGSLRIGGKTAGYYNTTAASYGLQAGAQSFGYAMFFMNEKGLNYLETSDGWEVGVGPSFVVVDTGMASSLTTTTTTKDIYVFFFNQKGLMAGLGVQGSKITKINPDK